MATINDIARIAGVNKSTVSRVFSRCEPISSEMSKKIRGIAAELGYTPNHRVKKEQAKFCIGILLSDLIVNPATELPFGSNLLYALIQAGSERHLHLITEPYDFEAARLRTPRLCREQRVSGLIALGLSSRRAYEKLQQLQLPWCSIGFTPEETPPEVYAVEADCFSGSCEAVEYLIILGHRKIAIIHGGLFHKQTFNKLEGYRNALRAHRMPENPDYVLQFDEGCNSYCESEQQTLRLLQLSDPPTAICYANDLCAIAGLSAIRQRGLTVPEDISIVGFDDSYLAYQARPRLTSVNIDLGELAAQAVELVMRQIRQQPIPERQITLQSRLTQRDSCAPPKGKAI